jgi:hypothetical protein
MLGNRSPRRAAAVALGLALLGLVGCSPEDPAAPSPVGQNGSVNSHQDVATA